MTAAPAGPVPPSSAGTSGRVRLDEAGDTVLLRTARGAHVFRVDRAAGTVRHVHWGAALPLADAAALPLWSDHDNSFAGRWDGTEEYPAAGGPRFGTPAWWPVGPEKRTIWKSCRKGRRSCARPPTG
ncbi:hypothetical protein AB0K88_14525 [Streptomyces werraensis]|uniref:hypothetical protein n=1 Tax=Streptomyces werraensis TaxID=68284 RepID=UPI003419A6E0